MADPLSLAANIAGLIAVVGKVVEISHALCGQVTPQQRFLQRLVEQVTDFHTVLEELSRKSRDDGTDNSKEQKTLRQVVIRCEKTIVDLCDRLNALRTLFAQGMAQRLWSAGKIKEALRDVENLRRDLSVSKETLFFALNLRIAKTTESLRDSNRVAELHGDIQKVEVQLQQLLQKQSDHPAQHYIQAASNASIDSDRLSGTTAVSSQESVARAALEEDLESIKLFDSFDAWIDSLSANEEAPEPSDGVTTEDEVPADTPPELGRDTKLKISVSNLNDKVTGQPEVMELSINNYVQDAIDILESRGHHGICGFKLGQTLISPAIPLMDPVPVHVTSGPSSYSPDWFSINVDEPLEEFYDNIFRLEYSRNNPLKTDIKDDQIEILDTHSGQLVFLSLSRTLRVPEDKRVYNQPLLFGRFPTVRSKDARSSLPRPVARKGGVLIPMLPREALAITMEGAPAGQRLDDKDNSCTLAIRVLCGGINAVSYKRESERMPNSEQDYIIAPAQRRLDGFNAWTVRYYNLIRQFVTMPAMEDYTVEEQITGRSAIHGIQMIMAPKFTSPPGEFEIDDGKRPRLVYEQHNTPRDLSLAMGSRFLVSSFHKRYRACYEGHDYGVSRDASSGKDGDICTLYGQAVTHFQTREFNIREHVFRSDQFDDECDTISTQPSVVCSESGCSRRLGNNSLQLAMRRRRFTEADLQLSSQLAKSSRRHFHLEAVCEVTIYLKVCSSPFSYGPGKEMAYKLSPLTPMRVFVVHLINSGVLCCQNTLKLILDGKELNLPETLLDQGCCDGSIIQVFEVSGLKTVLQNRNELPFSIVDSFKPSAWEMGVAAGGCIHQEIRRDKCSAEWNWHKSRHFNIQIMNAIAFKAFTGIEPPKPPLSFTQYINSELPFRKILQTAKRLGRDAQYNSDGIASISTIDIWKGVSRDTKYTGPVPFLCLNCEQMLADSM